MHDVMKNNSMVINLGSIDAPPASRHQFKDDNDGVESGGIHIGNSSSQDSIIGSNSGDASKVMAPSTRAIVDSAAGEVYSRMINNENYKKIIAAKGRVQFPSYIVSTIQN
jgi:hypothetical protein